MKASWEAGNRARRGRKKGERGRKRQGKKRAEGKKKGKIKNREGEKFVEGRDMKATRDG